MESTDSTEKKEELRHPTTEERIETLEASLGEVWATVQFLCGGLGVVVQLDGATKTANVMLMKPQEGQAGGLINQLWAKAEALQKRVDGDAVLFSPSGKILGGNN